MGRIGSHSEKPDAIIVFPDTSVQGVVEAIGKPGLVVPSQLRLCLPRQLSLPHDQEGPQT